MHVVGRRRSSASKSIENIADIEAGVFDVFDVDVGDNVGSSTSSSRLRCTSNSDDAGNDGNDDDNGDDGMIMNNRSSNNNSNNNDGSRRVSYSSDNNNNNNNNNNIKSFGGDYRFPQWMVSAFQLDCDGEDDSRDNGFDDGNADAAGASGADNRDDGPGDRHRSTTNQSRILLRRRKTKLKSGKRSNINPPRPSSSSFKSLRRSSSMDSMCTDGGRSRSGFSSARSAHYKCMSCSLLLILLVGIVAFAIILSVGTTSVQDIQRARFDDTANQVADKFQEILRNTEFMGLWTHHACSETLLERQRLVRYRQLQQQQGTTPIVVSKNSTTTLADSDAPNPYNKFRRFYQYVLQAPSADQRVSCAVNVSHEDRQEWEQDTKEMYASTNLTDPFGIFSTYIDLGFKVVQSDTVIDQGMFVRQADRPFYWPIHYMEPREAVVPSDTDLYGRNGKDIEVAVSTGQPTIGRRLPDIQFRDVLKQTANLSLASSQADPRVNETSRYSSYLVSLLHPGAPRVDGKPTGHLAVTPIRINGLLLQGFQALGALDCSLQVLIFDTSVHNKNVSTPAFLGGAIFHQDEIIRHEETPIEFVREIPYEDAIDQTMDSRRPRRYQSIRNLKIASQEWTFIVSTTSIGQDHQSERQQLTYIAVGAVTILFSTVFLSLLIFNNARRIRTLSRVTASAAAERAAMRLESARQSAQHERELNDFIAHEVRNPLNAALSANTFVSASVNEEQPLLTEESRRSVREDVQIIDNSLLFINELLRNMLDMHRAASQQLTVQWTSVDILRDVLEPVSSMIYRRGANFDVLVDCIHPTVPSSNIIVESDPLRLKQIMLNLGRNSAKFVEKGFIRYRTAVVDDCLHLYVEDSGPGVPAEKRGNLFGRFQESLDTLNQGTGIGLNLCKNLAELLHADLWLDENYDSGIPGRPGARFVLNLRTPLIEEDTFEIEDAIINEANNISEMKTISTVPSHSATVDPNSNGRTPVDKTSPNENDEVRELPEGISVLFVDDDFTLRKLFVRAVKRVTKNWDVDEAANGETALRKVTEKKYDIIFMDMYMTAIEKQLLGTEATRELRSKGCNSIIFGLSANDLERQFIEAGGNGFIMKPFQCKPDLLRQELFRVLECGGLLDKATEEPPTAAEEDCGDVKEEETSNTTNSTTENTI